MTKNEMKALENIFKAMWKDALYQQVVVEEKARPINRQMLTEKGNEELFTKLMLEANGARRFLVWALGEMGCKDDPVEIVQGWINDVETGRGRTLNTEYNITFKGDE